MTGFLASLVQSSDPNFFSCIISTRKSDMALAHWWCPALVWLHTFLYISFLFSTEDIAGMSCEIDVLFRRLSIYTGSLYYFKRHISLHASESYLPYQWGVVGLVWRHLKLTSYQLCWWMFCPFQTWLCLIFFSAESELPRDVIAFLTSKLLSCCPVCLRITLCALWEFLSWDRQLMMKLVKQ